jgi:hypothetical protein
MKKTLLLMLAWLFALGIVAQAQSEAAAKPVTVVQAAPEPSDKDFDVYPNPSQGVIHLSLVGFENRKTEVRITNVIGNLVHRDFLAEPDTRYVKTIDLSRFPKGVYYVKLQSDSFSEIRKVIIK